MIDNTAQPTEKPDAGAHRATPLFGWLSLSWLLLCVLVGSAMYAFLAASGQGWTHPILSDVQTRACQLMSCAPLPPPRSEQCPQLQGQLTALNANAAQAPRLRLELQDPAGIMRVRELTPADYRVQRQGDALLVNIDLASDMTYKTLSWQTIPDPAPEKLELAKHP
jgi:hypothetical protein